ncbi:hypothetical protein WS72_27065 [Burkholderia savannae]|uniref:Uncharacterized protein n=1 Tax=Burkholderia savannae TaxID=1637837 RepID=A0ABR5T5J5_9BURK|nr:hypothetical protein WS72_27065 [Burkholderia savannae]
MPIAAVRARAERRAGGRAAAMGRVRIRTLEFLRAAYNVRVGGQPSAASATAAARIDTIAPDPPM